MQNNVTDLPDIPLPLPEDTSKRINDEFDSGLRFAFIGSGQGGSRLASDFYSLGYRRVCCINTAEQDLALIPVPDALKLNLGGGGAGKNIATASKLVTERREDILDFMRRSFGESFDRIIVCAGLGGGTGAGSVDQLVRIAADLQEQLKCPSKKVGVLAALPKVSEGKRPHENAFFVLNSLLNTVGTAISPLVLIDNQKISQLYPLLSVNDFWNHANRSITTLFHLFNVITARVTEFTTFDVADYLTLLDSGLLTFGATPLAKWEDATDISYAIRDNLRRNILSGGIDLTTGNVAAGIVIGSKTILQKLPQAHLDHAFDQLTRLLRPGSTVHRGIYSGSKETLAVYTALGGLGRPEEKLTELRRLGDVLLTEKRGVGPVLGEAAR